MDNDKRHITINLLPQNPDAWGWVAVAFIVFFVTQCTMHQDTEFEQTQRVKAGAAATK